MVTIRTGDDDGISSFVLVVSPVVIYVCFLWFTDNVEPSFLGWSMCD
jgi:hypothetical protein